MKAVFSFIYLLNMRNRSDGAVADLYYDIHFISLKSNSFKCTMSKVKKQNKTKEKHQNANSLHSLFV